MKISCDLCRDFRGDEKIGFRILHIEQYRGIEEAELQGIWCVLEKIYDCKNEDGPFTVLCDNPKIIKVALGEEVDECTINGKLLNKVWLYDDLL